MALESVGLFECSVAASGCLNGSKGFWNYRYVSRSQFFFKGSKKMNNKQKNMKGNNIKFIVASLYLYISIWFISHETTYKIIQDCFPSQGNYFDL